MPRLGSVIDDSVWRVPKLTSFATMSWRRCWLIWAAAWPGVTAPAAEETAKAEAASGKKRLFMPRLWTGRERVARPPVPKRRSANGIPASTNRPSPRPPGLASHAPAKGGWDARAQRRQPRLSERDAGSRPCDAVGAARHVRPARPERRRQVHADAHRRHPADAERGHGPLR